MAIVLRMPGKAILLDLDPRAVLLLDMNPVAAINLDREPEVTKVVTHLDKDIGAAISLDLEPKAPIQLDMDLGDINPRATALPRMDRGAAAVTLMDSIGGGGNILYS